MQQRRNLKSRDAHVAIIVLPITIVSVGIEVGRMLHRY
jgi:hypothetical protein